MKDFFGWRRPDGKVGIRNLVLILPSVACAAETCAQISRQVKGTVYIPNQNGCGQTEGDLKITQDVLAGLAANPNVYGTILVGLGCENNQVDIMEKLIRERTNKPLRKLTIQENGGVLSTISLGAQWAHEMVAQASQLTREPFPVSELLVGTNCGGSDPTSGLASNPAVGCMSDLLIDAGSSSILCETTEFIGAEHILAKQAATPEIAEQILGIVHRYEHYLSQIGENLRNGNPSPGNKAGGITTLEEKSLGCIHKGGHRPVVEVTEYARAPQKRGLIIMDTPGYDMASVTGVAAGGAQVMVFTTGRGTPIGTQIMPVIKVTANDITWQKMSDNIDLNVSAILAGTSSASEEGLRILEEVIHVANGKMTKSEALGFNDLAISRVCNYV
ncbi:UxaA family hydrolase [Salmonella enterica]|nr:UxaA family hydrolase [Salmonella enterica]